MPSLIPSPPRVTSAGWSFWTPKGTTVKKVKILSETFVPSDVEGQMRTVYPGSVLSLDDGVAGALVAAQRAAYAPDDAKTVDTTKAHEAEADRRAAAATSPEASLAAAVAVAVQAAMAAAAAPAAEAGKSSQPA